MRKVRWYLPDGGVGQVLVSPDGPEHIAGLQAGRGAGRPAGQGHILNISHFTRSDPILLFNLLKIHPDPAPILGKIRSWNFRLKIFKV